MFGILRPSSREATPLPRPSTPPPPRSMAPVPQALYDTREELMDFVKSWAKDQGYAIVIERSRPNRLWLKCDRGGKYENRRNITDEQRKRKRGQSRLMGCPFLVIAVLKDNIWKVKTEEEKHNHEPSDDLTSHPSLRKLSKEQMNLLESMTDAGSTPADIMDALKVQYPGINIVKRDVYNARKKHKEHKRNSGAATTLDADEDEGQPWETPNGVVPGPTPTGKWVWAEAGDELVTKGKKKRQKIFVPNPPPALDPELENSTQPQTQNQAYAPDTLTSTITFPDFTSTFPDTAPSSSLNLHPTTDSHQPTAPLDRHNSAPNPLQQLSDFSSASNGMNGGPFSTSSIDDNSFFAQHQQHQRNSFPSISAPHLQQSFSTSRAEPAIMTSPTTQMTTRSAAAHNNNSSPSSTSPGHAPQTRSHNGQVLMSRIERMEKEQRDQKNMLTKILGAVTGQMADV